MTTRYEIHTFTLCGGWVNTWRIIAADHTETPETFATEAETQQALDQFLSEIQDEIAAGQRLPDKAIALMTFASLRYHHEQWPLL